MPGMRPPMGGAPHLVSAPPGAGGMGVLMPIYTIGIIIFFVYTMMKVISYISIDSIVNELAISMYRKKQKTDHV